MQGQGRILFIATFVGIVVIVVAVLFHLITKKKALRYRTILDNLEREKNLIASTPVSTELSKIEPIIKNERMEEKYNHWQDKFDDIKKNQLSRIDDMIVDLDTYFDKGDYKSCRYRIAKTELEIYKAREKANHLLEEIKEVTFL